MKPSNTWHMVDYYNDGNCIGLKAGDGKTRPVPTASRQVWEDLLAAMLHGEPFRSFHYSLYYRPEIGIYHPCIDYAPTQTEINEDCFETNCSSLIQELLEHPQEWRADHLRNETET